MSTPSSQWVDSLSAPASPSSYHEVREAPPRNSYSDILQYEEDFIAEQRFPQLQGSDDGTYYTEDEDFYHSDSNSNAHAGNQQTGREDNYNSSGGSPVPERSNRYFGPPSTWRAKTRQERLEISSLEALRARDLSIHLFNAFALKRRAMEVQSRNSAQDEEQDEEQKSNIEDDGLSSQFIPTKQWTAWPLPADEVPRGDVHAPEDDTGALNMVGPFDGRPSAELEECLMAQILKTAKERFEARTWDSHRPRVRNRSKGAASVTDAISTEVDESGDDIDTRPGIRFRPVVQADDEKSRSILRPRTRHIINDLDTILMSLHYARQAYVSTIDLSQSEYETEPEEGLTSRSVSRSRAISRSGISRSREVQRSRNSSVKMDPPATSDHEVSLEMPDAPNSQSRSLEPQRRRSNTPRRSRSRSPGSRQSKLGLRDWSDIVGIASMSGWPASAVMRTAKRCSELFREDMAFRTLNEGKLELHEGNGKSMPTWEYVEEVVSGESDTDSDIPKPTDVPRRRRRGRVEEIYCPVKECSRSAKGFSRTWNLNQHMKNRHPSLELRGRRSKSALLTEDSG